MCGGLCNISRRWSIRLLVFNRKESFLIGETINEIHYWSLFAHKIIFPMKCMDHDVRESLN